MKNCEFKVGDRVESYLLGKGTIISINKRENFPIKVHLDGWTIGNFRYFSLDGYSMDNEKEDNKTYKIEDNPEKTMKKVTRSDIFKEFARIEELREETDLQLTDLFKYTGEYTPFESFSRINMLGDLKEYTFALALVEGKPVFVGDKLWSDYFGKYVTIRGIKEATKEFNIDIDGSNFVLINNCFWNKPKSITFELNGKTLSLPEIKKFGEEDFYYLDSYNLKIDELVKYKWHSMEKRNEVAKEIQIFLHKLLSGKTE